MNIYVLGNFVGYNVYEYNKDGLKELITYNPHDHQMDVRTVFTLDELGRVIKAEEYKPPDFFDDASRVFEFEYNASGRLAVRESSIGVHWEVPGEEFLI